MKLHFISVMILFSGFALAGTGHKKITKQEYVDQWHKVAIEQMAQHKIPASITLAQGILESGSGNSELAVKGNNHFGIKCHNWDGKKMYKDDDTKNECFRVYKTAEQSYIDHSDFLKKYNRYAFLFDYKSDDYKSWAKGLKKAGYATNPKYPELLINLIEDLELHKYDGFTQPELEVLPSIAQKKEKQVSKVKSTAMGNVHQVYVHEKGVKYVVAKKGDTFYQIAQEFGLKLSQLYKYNDFDKHKDVLVPGDIVYIRPKKRRNLFKREVTVIEKEISLIELSQAHAVNINSIKKLNDITSEETTFAIGEKVTLR